MNALNAYNRLNANVSGLKKASEKLSSGYRINRAGDDAAGLAISEKMRSQIRGLNQAVRNSQDGINMIQTFEGAAQETHSILQRMKELATESANGTYDNATDRAAIQLEFDQLNDELNQIADTDFNGTIVLNGGEMSDGLKQIDGEFNYANKADQLIADATAAAKAEVSAAKSKYYDDLAALTEKPYDLSANGSATEWNSVDENVYGKNAADGLWGALGITKKDAAGDVIGVDLSKVTDIDVTFEFDGTDWVAKSVVTSDGKTLALPDGETDWSSVFTTTVSANPAANASGNGGFTVEWSPENDGAGNAMGVAGKVNAVFDATAAKVGDTVTLNFTNSAAPAAAPNNAGWANDSVEIVIAGKTQGIDNDANVTVKSTDVTTTMAAVDSDIDADTKAVLDVLNGAEIEYGAVVGTGNAHTPSLKVGGVSITDTTAVGTAGEMITLKDKDGNDVNVFVQRNDGTAGTAAANMKYAFYTAVDDGTGGYKKGDVKLLEIDFAKVTTTYDGTTGANNNVSFKGTLAISQTNYGDGYVAPDVEASSNPKLGTSTEARKATEASLKAWNDAQSKLDSIIKAKDNDEALAAAKKYLSGNGVSISDSFDNSTARMTYAKDITLQTGARTKDSVNFSFNYNTDGTADMGKLKANLNLSAREDGLNTANLSLANQDDANYAIDQIDKAINKTSMVRATFGSIQNRLEHKITNLTTTSENLTEAESSIRDTDMASEMMNYTKFNILQQAAQSMLAQANQQPQSILQLLG